MATKNTPVNAGKASAVAAGGGSGGHGDPAADAFNGSDEATVAAPVITSVALLTKAGEVMLRPGDTLIVCSTPDFWRAGVQHPAFAVYPPGSWSDSQLTLLRGEPKLKVVVVS